MVRYPSAFRGVAQWHRGRYRVLPALWLDSAWECGRLEGRGELLLVSCPTVVGVWGVLEPDLEEALFPFRRRARARLVGARALVLDASVSASLLRELVLGLWTLRRGCQTADHTVHCRLLRPCVLPEVWFRVPCTLRARGCAGRRSRCTSRCARRSCCGSATPSRACSGP